MQLAGLKDAAGELSKSVKFQLANLDLEQLAEIDIDIEFPDMPDVDKKQVNEIRKTAKLNLNLAKTLGIPNWLIFHLWN